MRGFGDVEWQTRMANPFSTTVRQTEPYSVLRCWQDWAGEYGPVHFQSRGVDVWLPQTADLVSERKGKRFHERITFSDYLLFQIDNQQQISPPKPQDWLAELDHFPAQNPQEKKPPVSFILAKDAQVSGAPD